MPDHADLIGGSTFRALVESGHIHPYPLARPPELREAAYRMRDRHFAALALVVAAELGCKTGGLAIRHADMAALLHCCERTAGTVMRDLASWGLVACTPFYERVGVGHLRCASLYRTTPGCRAIFNIGTRKRTGKTCQAKDIALRADQNDGVSGGGDAPDVGRQRQSLKGRGSPPVGKSTRAALLERLLSQHAAKVEQKLRDEWQKQRAAMLENERRRIQMLALEERDRPSSATQPPTGAGCSCELHPLGFVLSLCGSPRCEHNPTTKGN